MEEAESKQPVEETEENDEEMAAKAAEKAARRYAEADAEDLEALGAESSSEDEAMDGPGEVSKEAAANGNEEDVWKVEKQSGQEGTEKGLKQVPVSGWSSCSGAYTAVLFSHIVPLPVPPPSSTALSVIAALHHCGWLCQQRGARLD